MTRYLSFKHFLILCLTANQRNTNASSWSRPHIHSGKLRPFDPLVEQVQTTMLDSTALRILQSGRPYKTSQIVGTSSRTLVIQDVEAPTEFVLDRILDYDNYSKMAPQTLESETYYKSSDSIKETIFSRLRTGIRGLYVMEFFVKANYYPSLNSVTWTLDYTKQSDIDDACGYWQVIPHPDNPSRRSRIYYSVDLVIGSNVPNIVGSFINQKAASDATSWVKKFSE